MWYDSASLGADSMEAIVAHQLCQDPAKVYTAEHADDPVDDEIDED